jgi:hypothetical protein
MGMFSIEMCDSHPFQSSSEILFDPIHQTARQASEVNALAEFGRDYELPQALIPRSLP